MRLRGQRETPWAQSLEARTGLLVRRVPVRASASPEALVRQANNVTQAKPDMTPELLGAARLPVHREGRAMAAAKPESAPEFQIMHPESRKITVPFRETGAGGGSPSRSKPEGVRACEIWRARPGDRCGPDVPESLPASARGGGFQAGRRGQADLGLLPLGEHARRTRRLQPDTEYADCVGSWR